MSKIANGVSRRKFFKWGAGAVGSLASVQALANLDTATPAQPLGPFFPREGTPVESTIEPHNPEVPIYLANDNDLTFVQGVGGEAEGQRVYLSGTIFNSQGDPVENASVIIWQASATGRYNHQGDTANEAFHHPSTGEVIERDLDPSFQYWGKATTDSEGRYFFKTIVPGFYPADLANEWYRPPHIHFLVSAMGQPQFVTQMYFRGEELPDNDWIQELNDKDLLLQNPNLTFEEKEGLIVDFKMSQDPEVEEGLVGEFDISLG